MNKNIAKIISSMLCVSMLMGEWVQPTYASTKDTQSTSSNEKKEVEVLYNKSASYFVTIPKTITLDSNKESSYSVKVDGDIASDQEVYVSPIDSIGNKDGFNFYMKDQSTKHPKADVIADVTQNKFYWDYEDAANAYEETNNNISASDLSSGAWKGTFDFEINMHRISNEKGFTLSTDGDVTMGLDDTLQVNAYLDGTPVTNEVSWSSNNPSINVEKGLLKTSASAKVGDSSTITVVANTKEQLASVEKALSNVGIMTAHADDTLTASFKVTIVDIELSSYDLYIKPGESATLNATILPLGTEGTVNWTRTAVSGLNLMKNGNSVEIFIASDMEVGKTYQVVASFGDFSKVCTIHIGENAHKHTYTSEVTKEPTCTEAGETTFTCVDGDDSYTEVIQPLGHNFSSEYTVDKEPTHTEAGSKSQHCSRCDAKQNVTSIPATGHKYNDGVVTKNPTCTEKGVKTFTCVDGDHSYTEEIPAIGHNYGEATYTWSSDKSTCTAKRVCANDASHVETETVNSTNAITKNATCTETGTKTYTATFENNAFANQTTTSTISTTEHKYTSTITKEANYLENGIRTYTCSNCGNTYTENIPKLEDTIAPEGTITIKDSIWKTFLNTITFNTIFNGTQDVVINATDKESGVKSIEYYIANDAISKENLANVEWKEYTNKFSIDPENNYVIYAKIIDNCNNETIINSDGVVINCNHQYANVNKNWKVVDNKDDKFIQDGNTWSSFNITNKRIYTKWEIDVEEDIEYSFEYAYIHSTNGYTGGTYGDDFDLLLDGKLICYPYGATRDTYNTTLTKGKHTLEMSLCLNSSTASSGDGAYIVLNPLPIKCSTCGLEHIEHNFNDAIITKEPTCSEIGISKRICKDCGYEETTILPKVQHNYVNNVCTICNQFAPGLYDENDNLVCAWEDLNIDAEKDYDYFDSKYNSILNSYTNGVKLIIPNNITKIGDYTFKECNTLKTIVIPNNITIIGSDAFENCTSLTSVEMANDVINIKDSAFRGCTNLTDIIIPNSVTSIEFKAFQNCSSLSTINIPNKVKRIGDDAFSNCTNLQNIDIEPCDLKPSEHQFFGTCVFENCKNLKTLYLPNNTIFEGEKNDINNAIFYGSNCKKVFYSKSIESSGNSYWNNYGPGSDKVTFMKINNKYDYLLLKDFDTNQENIIIPEGLTMLPESYFMSNRKIKSIVLPSSITTIGDDAFFNSTLELIDLKKCNHLKTIGDGTFNGCSNLTSITIPNSVTKIEAYAFFGCSGLTSIIIPDSVTSIGFGAFSYCTGLTSITIPDSVTNIDSGAFQSCTNLSSITYKGQTYTNKTQLTNALTSNGVYVGSYVFDDTKLQE